jgi:HPt (histidine-containing phosphotransfer) domain-containing protein
MTDPLDEAMLELQREYLAEFPERLEELRADIAAFRALRPEPAASLKIRFHRLAGFGGSYGFPGISVIAREMEQWMAGKPAPGEAPRLDEAVDRLALVFRQAQARLGSQPRSSGARPRATVILPATPDLGLLVQASGLKGMRCASVGGKRTRPTSRPESGRTS